MKNNNIKLCPICIAISSIWLILSAGVAWKYLPSAPYMIPIALLMGGTVVGIAYLGEKRCRWAAHHPQIWKFLIVFLGMPIAYFLITHIAKLIVIGEFFSLLIIAYFFFIKQPSIDMAGGSRDNKNIREIEKKMEQCC